MPKIIELNRAQLRHQIPKAEAQDDDVERASETPPTAAERAAYNLKARAAIRAHKAKIGAERYNRELVLRMQGLL